MVEQQPSKLNTRVRFPSPAPIAPRSFDLRRLSRPRAFPMGLRAPCISPKNRLSDRPFRTPFAGRGRRSGTGYGHGQGKIRADEAALQHRHDWSRRPWQDVADGCDHEGSGRVGRGHVHGVRPDRQGAGREGARDHDLDGARRVRDEGAPLRPRRLPRPRRLREEHDHGRGADGRRDPGGFGRRRPDAADARAHPAGPPGRRSGAGGVHEQGRPGRRPGADRAGRARSSRAAVEVRVPGRRHSDHQGLGAGALEGKTPGDRP